jgi:NAD(P)-dependent dehydrogenase (short-subunit alcohol dehydrogenase family)
MKIESGQTVLLTGASGGVGTFIAHAFAGCGVKLVLVAYPSAELEAWGATLAKRGGEVLTFTPDFRDPEQRRRLVEEVRRRLGPVDILVNNAGVEFNSFYQARMTSPEWLGCGHCLSGWDADGRAAPFAKSKFSAMAPGTLQGQRLQLCTAEQCTSDGKADLPDHPSG